MCPPNIRKLAAPVPVWRVDTPPSYSEEKALAERILERYLYIEAGVDFGSGRKGKSTIELEYQRSYSDQLHSIR